jgi:hypothetical protein
VVSMDGNDTMALQGVPSSKPIPEEDHLLGHNVNHLGEIGQKA